MLFGIDVIIVAPGAVKTPIWSKAEEVDISPYKNSPFLPAMEKMRAFMLALGANGLPPERIAETAASAILSGGSPLAPSASMKARIFSIAGKKGEFLYGEMSTSSALLQMGVLATRGATVVASMPTASARGASLPDSPSMACFEADQAEVSGLPFSPATDEIIAIRPGPAPSARRRLRAAAQRPAWR